MKDPKKNLPVPVTLGDRATKCSHTPSCQLHKKGNHLQLGGKTVSQEREQLKLLQVASPQCSQPSPHSELLAICSPYDLVHFHTSDNHSFHIIIRRDRLSFSQDLLAETGS